jgi:hypothetical protein
LGALAGVVARREGALQEAGPGGRGPGQAGAREAAPEAALIFHRRIPGLPVIALVGFIAAIALGVLIARDCDAADWAQGVMIAALPLLAGASAGAGVLSIGRGGSRRTEIGIAVCLLGAGLAFLVIGSTWFGRCSA